MCKRLNRKNKLLIPPHFQGLCVSLLESKQYQIQLINIWKRKVLLLLECLLSEDCYYLPDSYIVPAWKSGYLHESLSQELICSVMSVMRVFLNDLIIREHYLLTWNVISFWLVSFIKMSLKEIFIWEAH